MSNALSSTQAATKTENLLSACATVVRVFRGEWSSNFSSHSFPQKPKEPEWGSRFPAASSKRTAGQSREKIVTTAARVLQFASLRQKRTNRRRLSSVLDRHAEPKTRKAPKVR